METMNLTQTEGKAGLLLCTNGRRQVLINGQLYHIEKGILCFFSPIITIYELSRSEDYTEDFITDDADVFYQAIRLIYDMILNFRVQNNPCLLLDEERIRFFHEQQSIIKTKKEYALTVKDKDEQQVVWHIIHLLEQETMLEFIHLYYRNCIVKPVSVDKNEAIAFKFIYSLHLNYKEQRNVSFYASELNVSLSHFTRIVKEKTGKTPSEWIADMTIINAKLMLKQSDMSIKEIASELHFPEQFTFRKFFKLHVGIPPKEYRLKNRMKE